MTDVDTIVIGSGAGGMAAAVSLSKAGQKVLLLEQHYLPGGWCHSFPLEGYLFSPGVHYVGDLGPGGIMRRMYEGMGVANDMTWLELDRQGYDCVRIGDRSFDIPAGVDAYRERLEARFPADRDGIRTYLGAVEDMRQAGKLWMRVKGPKTAFTALRNSGSFARWGLRTAGSMVNATVSDPFLRAILTIQSGNHGMAPKDVPAFVHTAIVGHYLDGGAYPMGGARSIPRAFLKALRRNGSSIQVRAEVRRILLDTEGGRRVRGVALADGTEITCKQVISNADPTLTFERMVGAEHLSARLKRKLARTRYGGSCLSLFFALDRSPRDFGMTSGNVWHSPTPDIDGQYVHPRTAEAIGANGIQSLFLTATTLKDPTKVKNGHHTLEAFTFTDSSLFSRWARSSHEERPQSYYELKAQLQQRMLDKIDELFPGMKEHVVFAELGTPITNKHYVASVDGHLYGTEKSFSQLGPMGFMPRTEIEGLYLAGASVGFHGVAGATMSGVTTASLVLRQSMRSVLQCPGQELKLYPAEHPEQWPEALQAKLPERAVAHA